MKKRAAMVFALALMFTMMTSAMATETYPVDTSAPESGVVIGTEIVEVPIVTETPAEETEEVTGDIIETPAEEITEEIVEIEEVEIPLAAEMPATVSIRAIVYQNGEIVYEEDCAPTEALFAGNELDLNGFVWTDIGGITFTGDASAVTLEGGANEFVLTYELAEGWVILD